MPGTRDAEFASAISYIDGELKRWEPVTDWRCVKAITPSLFSPAMRSRIEKHYCALGFEVKRERRFPHRYQQRVRGLWLKRQSSVVGA